MRPDRWSVAASIKAEGSGVAVVTISRKSTVIALRESRLADIWDRAGETEFEEFQPRTLIVICGPQKYAPLEGRLELQLLRMLLASSRWCRCVDFERITMISAELDEIRTVCGWLSAADAFCRIAATNQLFRPRVLFAEAPRLLDLEMRPDRTDEFRRSWPTPDQPHA